MTCKDMKDKMDGAPGTFDEAYARSLKAQVALRKDYDKRKPLAWAAARAALAASEKETGK